MAEKRSGFFAEFKKFAFKGNVMDLAVGVIIGGAFATITKSLTDDIIMPIASMFLGGLNFSSWQLTLPNFFGLSGDAPNTLNFGTFLSTVLNFLILAFVVFLMVRSINRLRERNREPAAPAAPPEPTKEEALLTEIRDLLKEK